MNRQIGQGDRPRVSVVVVTYNSGAVIEECLAPLANEPSIEILVFDNDSRDNTLAKVASIAPDARIIRSPENLGFARAVNEASMTTTGEYILLLNPDARIDADNVSALSRALDADENIGVIAPVLDKPGNRLTIREGGRQPSLWRVLCHYYGLSRISRYARAVEGLYLLRHLSFESRDVDWVSGACLLARSDLWFELDGLTTRWFMYAEDLEFCLRVKRSGRRIVMSSAAVGTHTIGQSSLPSPSHRPNSAWVVNLFDLYKWRISRTRVQNISWKFGVGGGLFLRSVAYQIRSARDTANQDLWAEEARKFRWHCADLLQVSSARHERRSSAEGIRLVRP